MKTRHRATDWLFLLALTVMWGSAFMLTKIAVGGLPPTVVVAGRLVLACVLLFGVAVVTARRLPTLIFPVVLGGLAMTHPTLLSSLIARTRGLVFLCLAMVSPGVATALSPQPVPQRDGPVPSPQLAPAEVVRIQVEALRNNSLSNDGIELTYRFASPDNKRYTGPLDRFIDMVRSAPYDRLLNHRRAEYSPMAVSGNQAQQIVVIIDAEGEEVGYLWVLSRQTDGAFKDCWMTDAVISAQREVQRQLTQHSLWNERLFALSIQPRPELETSIARTADG